MDTVAPPSSTYLLSNQSLLLNTTAQSNISFPVEQDVTSPAAIGVLSLMFCMIGCVGISGNVLVTYFVLSDRRMRQSVTNLFIMNLAVSDLVILVFGIPDIAMFMINHGWLLGDHMCRATRYILTFSLYASVMTAVGVCIERYIAIVHPMKARIYCSRRNVWSVISCIWPSVVLLGLPVALYNGVGPPGNGPKFCRLSFPPVPGNPFYYLSVHKYCESTIFYLVPMVIQIVCYAIICKHLFRTTPELQDNTSNASDRAAQARKGVVKMLIASVLIYFISYSPHQVLLFYNTFSHAPFRATWVYLVFTTAMGYINSASNPVLYCIFCATFRCRFKRTLLCRRKESEGSVASQRIYTRVPLQPNGECV